MIGKLKGIVEHIAEDSLLLDVGGVCYLVFLSSRALQQLPPVGQAVSVFIETHVREDHIHLYGFLTANDKVWFNTLCTVQGVAAKMALAILGSFTPADLVQAISARDSKMLTRAKGVGPKLAERLVTELKNKVESIPSGDVSFAAPSGGKGSTPPAGATTEEAVSALANLGYGRSDAFRVVTALQAEQPEIGLNELIRHSLQRLAK